MVGQWMVSSFSATHPLCHSFTQTLILIISLNTQTGIKSSCRYKLQSWTLVLSNLNRLNTTWRSICSLLLSSFYMFSADDKITEACSAITARKFRGKQKKKCSLAQDVSTSEMSVEDLRKCINILGLWEGMGNNTDIGHIFPWLSPKRP